jgi:ketol-acid reductoisomerase
MASRTLVRSLRTASKSKAPVQTLSRRTFTSVLAARPASAPITRAALAGPIQQQIRGVKTIDFAGSKETVYGNPCCPIYCWTLPLTVVEREDWPREKLLVRMKLPDVACFFLPGQGLFQKRHARSYRLWISRPWTRSQPSRQWS